MVIDPLAAEIERQQAPPREQLRPLRTGRFRPEAFRAALAA